MTKKVSLALILALVLLVVLFPTDKLARELADQVRFKVDSSFFESLLPLMMKPPFGFQNAPISILSLISSSEFMLPNYAKVSTIIPTKVLNSWSFL